MFFVKRLFYFLQLLMSSKLAEVFSISQQQNWYVAVVIFYFNFDYVGLLTF